MGWVAPARRSQERVSTVASPCGPSSRQATGGARGKSSRPRRGCLLGSNSKRNHHGKNEPVRGERDRDLIGYLASACFAPDKADLRTHNTIPACAASQKSGHPIHASVACKVLAGASATPRGRLGDQTADMLRPKTMKVSRSNPRINLEPNGWPTPTKCPRALSQTCQSRRYSYSQDVSKLMLSKGAEDEERIVQVHVGEPCAQTALYASF